MFEKLKNMDLSVVYSKTPKGLRARASLIGGLSSHLMKVLSHVDGNSKAEIILLKFDALSPQQLSADLNKLTQEGYIRLAVAAVSDSDWALTSNFTPMEVEEYQSEQELDAIGAAKVLEQAKLVAEELKNAEKMKELAQQEIAKKQQEEQLAAQIKKDKKAQKVLDKQKLKAEIKVKAKLAADAEAARLIKYQAEQAQLEAARAAKVAEETRQKAELKAREAAEQEELKAQQHAIDTARREIGRIAKEAEETQRQQIADKNAKLEAERIEATRIAELQAEETAAKELANEAARQEIASILRKAEDDRKKLATKLKEEKLEAKRKAKSDQEKKFQEEKQQIAAAKALEIEQQAAQKELDNIASKAHEINMQQNADNLLAALHLAEQADLASKENARLEMARIANEADALRHEQHTLQYKPEQPKSLPVLDDFDALEALEEAAFAAEERVDEAKKLIADDISITAQQTKENADIADIKLATVDLAVSKEKLYATKVDYNFTKPIIKTFKLLAKWLLIYVPLCLLLLIGLMHFVNISALIKPIAKHATDAVGAPVEMSEVRAGIWPQPHLMLKNVIIGEGKRSQTIGAIQLQPSIFNLIEDVKKINLEIEDINIAQVNVEQLQTWIANLTSANNIVVEQINLKNLTFNIKDLQLEPLNGKINLDDSHKLKNIELIDKNNGFFMTATPRSGGYEITLKANNWALPLNPKIIFKTLNATAVASQNKLAFNLINSEIYDGDLSANGVINWAETNANNWVSSGSFKLSNADTPLLLTAFDSAVSVEGKLNLNGNFSGNAALASNLASNTKLAINFVIDAGSIGDIELARALIASGYQSLAGDATNFNKLAGAVNIKNGEYQYNKLVMTSSQLNATGYLNINKMQDVDGKINAELVAQSRRLQSNFAIGGRGKDLKSR